MELDYRPFDADQHYYEALDCFTRYQDKAMARRGVQVLEDGKRRYIVVADKLNRFIANPTFNPVVVPGSTELMFRGQVPAGVDPSTLMRVEPKHAEYQARDERLKVMDEQDIAATLMFPTLGVGVEEALIHDPEATSHAVTSFNRWLEEDWGFAHLNRIFAVPLLSLADPAAALAELNRLLDRGAKAVHMRPAPVPSAKGPRSFGHPDHDPIWATLSEAGIPVTFHLGDSGYNRIISGAWGGVSKMEPHLGKPDALDGLLVDDRAIYDTMASMITHGVFNRFPNLRVASIENGSDWMALLVKKMNKKANQSPSFFPEAPIDVLRRNVWCSPYYEEDLTKLASLVGVNKILFGSDWPHGEGLAEPLQFTKELTEFSDADIRKIMRENTEDFLGVKGAQ